MIARLWVICLHFLKQGDCTASWVFWFSIDTEHMSSSKLLFLMHSCHLWLFLGHGHRRYTNNAMEMRMDKSCPAPSLGVLSILSLNHLHGGEGGTVSPTSMHPDGLFSLVWYGYSLIFQNAACDPVTFKTKLERSDTFSSVPQVAFDNTLGNLNLINL